MPLEIQRRVWGVEEFEAALSYVPIADGEDDLFAGLGSPARPTRSRPRPDLELVHDGRITEEPEIEEGEMEHGRARGDSSETHADEDDSDGRKVRAR